MALDPSIALQFKPLQIESPNALADYAMLAKLQEGQQAQQLNALKLEEARLGAQNRNRLRELDINAPDYIAQVTRIDPALGLQLHKERAAAEASQAQTAERRASAAKTRREMLGQAWRDISGRPSDSNINKYLEDIEASSLFTTEDKTSARRTAMSLLDMPFDQRGAAMAQYGASAGELRERGAPTELQKTIAARDALPVGDPRRATYDAAINKLTTHAPGTSVHMPPMERAEKGEYGKFLVDEYKGINSAAKLASRTLPSIETNLSILNKGFDTGFGTETKAAGAKVLAALGLPDADKYATNAQTFLASASQAVLQKQLEQKGVQTKADSDRIEQTGAQLGNTKEANKFVLNVAKAQLKRDIAQRDFYQAWQEKHGTFNGAERAWYEGEGGKSLFDSPELRGSVGAPAEAPAKAPAAKPTGRPAGVGANWTLEVDANGNKAYVSPDRKSFKEVK